MNSILKGLSNLTESNWVLVCGPQAAWENSTTQEEHKSWFHPDKQYEGATYSFSCISYRIVIPFLMYILAILNLFIRYKLQKLVKQVMAVKERIPEQAGIVRRIGTGSMSRLSSLLRAIFLILIANGMAGGYLVAFTYSSTQGIISTWCYVLGATVVHANTILAARSSLRAATMWQLRNTKVDVLTNSTKAKVEQYKPKSGNFTETDFWIVVVIAFIVYAVHGISYMLETQDGRYVLSVIVVYGSGAIVSIWCLLIVLKSKVGIVYAAMGSWKYKPTLPHMQQNRSSIRIVLKHFVTDICLCLLSLSMYSYAVWSAITNQDIPKVKEQCVVNASFAVGQSIICYLDFLKYTHKSTKFRNEMYQLRSLAHRGSTQATSRAPTSKFVSSNHQVDDDPIEEKSDVEESETEM